VLSPLIEPGFFGNSPVHVALAVGGIVAVVSAVVGTFTVVRGQSFAGHALADVGSAGGATLYGFVVMNLAAAGVMELIGIRRPRGRDVATGIVLGASLGLAALFLYLDTTYSTTSGATLNVLFGSIFTITPGTVPAVAVLGGATLLGVGAVYRPLLLSSVSDELAAARGVRVRLVGVVYLVALAVAVSLAAVTIGAILSTALLVGPAATVLRLARRPGRSMALAAALGLAETWLGILLAYDSAAWFPGGQGWPASFCIVAVVFSVYLATTAATARRERGGAGRDGGDHHGRAA
jgi:zinc/manganese transport system permease protein